MTMLLQTLDAAAQKRATSFEKAQARRRKQLGIRSRVLAPAGMFGPRSDEEFPTRLELRVRRQTHGILESYDGPFMAPGMPPPTETIGFVSAKYIRLRCAR